MLDRKENIEVHTHIARLFGVKTKDIERIYLTDGRWWPVDTLEITFAHGEPNKFEAWVRDEDEEGWTGRHLVGSVDQILLVEAPYS
jgi:hypothetical protein